MVISLPIRKDFESAFGSPLRYPGDFDALSESIMKKTGQRVSVNTLKRLFGLIRPEVEPRASTLDILGLYLGARDWADYLARLSDAGNSDFEQEPRVVVASSLTQGAIVSFRYHPDRMVRMQYIGWDSFLVTESENSKLKPGDQLTVRSLCSGYPLTADHVLRDGKDLGAFIAGKVSGLNDISIE